LSDRSVIATKGLTKFYGAHRGVQGVDLAVGKGEIFGLLGPNGSGKTTLIRLLLDLIRPTEGQAFLFGMDCHEDHLDIVERVGYVPGDVAVYDSLTGNEFLDYCASFHQMTHPQRKRALAERLDIDLTRRLKNCSKGMKQKVMIVQALMHDADLLILDEPTSGLDPITQRIFNEILFEERDKGKTLFVSSHILPEVQKICGRVGIIREGRLAAVERVDALGSKRLKTLTVRFAEQVPASELRVEGVTRVEGEGLQYVLSVSEDLNPILNVLSRHPVLDMSLRDADLEEVFMQYYAQAPQQKSVPKGGNG